MYPHLPKDNPRAVIINPNVNLETIAFLKENGIDVIFSKKASSISSSVAYHPDIQIAHIDRNLYVCAPEFYEYYKEMLLPYGAEIIKGHKDVLSNYPDDIAYNVLRVGKTSFAKIDYTDEVCLFHLEKSGAKCVNTNQGYAKCNACIVDENSIITSDISIHTKATENSINSLLINQGDIRLEGFEYGFIGGASFKLNQNTICFLGDISRHSDYKKIYDFLHQRNVNIHTISNDMTEDFGSVILVF